MKAKALERDTKALQMKIEGASLAQIDAKLRYGGDANVSRAIKRRLTDLNAVCDEKAEELRRLSIMRLEHLIAAAWKKLPAKEWWDRILRADESMRRLNGTDAAARHEHSGEGGGPIQVDFASLTREQIERIACGDFGALAEASATGASGFGTSESGPAESEDSSKETAD